MKVLPYGGFVLRSDDPPEVVAGRLAEAVSPRRFFFTRPPEPFGGRIEGRRFKVLRIHQTFLGMRSRNSFQAVVLGELVPHAGGTEVRVVVRLHRFVAIFMAIWFGTLLCIGGVSLWKDAPAGTLAGVAVMATLGFLLLNVPFWADVKQVRALLCQRLGCREVRPAR